MEQVVEKLVNIDEPMVLISDMSKFNEYYIPVSEVLYHNEEICLVELGVPLTGVKTPYFSRNFLFDKKTGKGLYGVTPWTIVNPPPVFREPLSLSERAREFASRAHRRVNQYYDGKPYMFHVDMAAAVANQFKHIIPEAEWEYVLAGVYLHDIIEDARVTYNDLKVEFGEPVANFSFALSNEKGKTRDERANPKYYREMREVPHAIFGKLCDRIANIQHGINTGGSMLKRYRKEHAKFVSETYDPKYQEMFDHLDKLLVQ